MKRPLPQKIRIIAGKHRGRKIPVPEREGLRPSPERVRETVFNWLQNEISGAAVLDAFAGSGAMGLEALSRGAGSVLFCDNDASACAAIRDHLEQWRETHARVLCCDALHMPSDATRYDIIFIDPPFHARLQQRALETFLPRLLPHGKLYLESAEALDCYTLPDGYQWRKQNKAGQVRFGLIGKTA